MKTWEKNLIEGYRKDWLHLRRMAKLPGSGQANDKRECEKARQRLLKAIKGRQDPDRPTWAKP